MNDLRYALRYFARTPLATVTMILTLGLGVGFSSAVFSTIAGVYTRPATGVPDDAALVKIRGKTSERPFWRKMSLPEVRAFAERTETFASVAAWTNAGVVLDAGNDVRAPLTAFVQFATPNFFTTLGIQPLAGRWFDAKPFDDLASVEPTVVLGEALAAELYGDPRSAVGRAVKVNGVDATIVGVAQPGFTGPQQARDSRRLWMPIATMPQVQTTSSSAFTDVKHQNLDVFARLRPGMTADQAEPVVRGVAARLNGDAQAAALGDQRSLIFTADVIRLRGVIDPLRYAEERGPMVVIFSLLSIIVLLICTTTVNSLLVGTAIVRRYEFGVRLALGASRARVVRQLLTEVALISLAGGAIGMWLFGVLVKITEISQDGFDVSPDWTTVAFTALYALLTAAIAGLAPALHATKAGLAEIMKSSSSGGRSTKLQRTFVIAQIAIAQPLMVILATMVVNFYRQVPELREVEFRERLLIAEFETFTRWTANTPDQMPALVRRLREHPGVHSVLHLGDSSEGMVLARGASAADLLDVRVDVSGVTPDYFKTVGTRITYGREFTWSDTTPSLVRPVILSRPLADTLFKGVNPIGQTLHKRIAEAEQPFEMQVVGVAEIDVANSLDFEGDSPLMFMPLRRTSTGRVLIRTNGPAEPVIQALHQIAREEARLTPLKKIGSLAGADRMRRDHKIGALGAGAGMGAVVLTFASIGLYALLAIAVGQRTREIGVRVALGADSREVVMMFFRNGVKTTVIGLAFGLPFGLAGMLAFARGNPWLIGAAPAIVACVVVSVIGVGAAASWIPARRAARVDPMVALRSE